MLTADDGKLLRSLGYVMAENCDCSEAKSHFPSTVSDGPRSLVAEKYSL